MIKNYKLPLRPIERTSSERVSVFTSRKGSITVEAAIAVPIFFLAVVCLLYLMEMMAVQTAVRSGLQYAGKRAAQEYAIKPFMQTKQLEKEVVEGIGADRLERSIVEGGSAGIDCVIRRCQYGQELRIYRRNTGFVFQFRCFPSLR